MTLRTLTTLPLLLALVATAASSDAAPHGARDPQRPTLVAGEAERITEALKVGRDGAEWALPGGCRIVAAPDTELRIFALPQPVVLGGKTVPGYTVLLRSGHVRAHVPVNAKSAVVLSAPKKTSVLVARGETSVVAGNHVAVANADGIASVGSAGMSFRELPAGTLEVIESRGSLRRPIPASPSGLHGSFVAVSYGGERIDLGAIGWDRVGDAAAYRVELRDAISGHMLARLTSNEPRLPAGYARLPVGSYAVSVRTIDKSGLESARSADQPIRVIGFTLPAGGYVDARGAVRIPPRGRIPLSHVDGVEMTYGASQRFVPVPPSLELYVDEARLVRFRVVGSQVESPLWLRPREARARIEFGPKAPRWPDSPLEIRVRLEDGSGGALPSFIEPRPRVLVGIEPALIEFSKTGEWLHAVLPARPGKGPWVVRVEVEDQNGIALGRDFVEVAGTKTPEKKRKGS